MDLPWLTLLAVLPTVGALAVLLAGARAAKQVALVTSLLTLALAVLLAAGYAPGGGMQYLEQAVWIRQLGAYYALGLDGIGLTLVLLVVVVTLRVRTTRRRTAFADQLDDTLRLMASSLRAGHSVQRALESVAHEAEAPTSEEFSRVLNEVRVGRDLVVALDEVAERTRSTDFSWVAQAVAVHREVGGNLAEVLDRVGVTIRDRTQLRRQAQALSAEGRISGVVLLALPAVLLVVLQVVAPEYVGRLTGTDTGVTMLAVAAVLMAAGALWMRRVVRVEF